MSRRSSFSWSLVAGAALLAACNGDSGPRAPSSIVALVPTAITGTVGEAIAEPLRVQITDERGAFVPGVAVTFAVAEGGGAVTPAVDTTDATGVASTRWQLGGAAGSQRVTATAAGVGTVINFVATAAPGAAAGVAVQAGDNQSAMVGTSVAVAPSVIVRDRFNNPVSGVSVVFSVAAGGGTVTGPGVTTGANGVATVGSWTLGANAGANRLTALALASGISGNPITFNATATAGAAAALQPQGGTQITGTVGTLVTPVPAVRVVDAGGNPVSNVVVTFTASTGSTVVGSSKASDMNGLAAPDGWQLGSTTGSYTLTANVGTLSTTFTATARAGAAATMLINAGNNQTATVGRTLPIDPAVRITDALGNPVAGQEVVFDVISGGGTALVRRPLTDANGVATVGAWTLGETPGTNTLRATATGLTIAGSPATFTATATAGAPASMAATAGTNQTAIAGSLVPVAPSVVVRDNRGNPVAGITVTFAPATGSGTVTGGSATTNAAGVATVGSWRLGTTAGTQVLVASATGVPDVTFTATATVGEAASIVVVGDSVLPSFPVNSFVSPLPTVRVRDANGNPVSGVQVTFEAVTGTGNTLTGETRTTGTDGTAQLTTWRIGTAAGTYRVRVAVEGLTTPSTAPTWRVVGTALTAAEVSVAATSVASQTATASAQVATVPAVRVVDQFGNPVSGVTVTFTVATGNGTLGVDEVSSLAVTTDALGFASVGRWTMPAGSGTRTLTATVTGTGITGNPVTFTATVPTPPPAPPGGAE